MHIIAHLHCRGGKHLTDKKHTPYTVKKNKPGKGRQRYSSGGEGALAVALTGPRVQEERPLYNAAELRNAGESGRSP